MTINIDGCEYTGKLLSAEVAKDGKSVIMTMEY